MAQLQGVSDYDFIQQFTRVRPDRQGLSLIEKPNGECVFLEGTHCRVQPVKPQQCRDFPNLWNFPGYQVCRAIPMELSDEEYRAALFKATGRMPA